MIEHPHIEDVTHMFGRSQARGNGADRSEPPPFVITPKPFVWRDPSTIPTRQWLYAKHMARQFVSCTFAGAGVGKSTLLLGETLAMVTRKNLLGHSSPSALRVWCWNGEDPLDEIERRAAAIMLHYRIKPEEIGDRLFLNSGRDTEIVIATVEKGGVKIAEPVFDAMVAAIKRDKIDVLIIDPFVSCHRVVENDNPAIDAVAKTWAKIADRTNCAVELVHHVRKTGGAEVTAEDGRGASSLIGAARSVRVLNVMSEDEAARAGVDKRRSFFRVDNGKSNMAPPPEKSEWFNIVSQPLGNGGDGDGDGDWIGVATPWEWPNPLDGLCVADLRKVQLAIAGGEHAENSQASNWAGKTIAAVLGLDISKKSDKERVKSLLRLWIESGALRVETRRNSAKGRDQGFVVVGEQA